MVGLQDAHQGCCYTRYWTTFEVRLDQQPLSTPETQPHHQDRLCRAQLL